MYAKLYLIEACVMILQNPISDGKVIARTRIPYLKNKRPMPLYKMTIDLLFLYEMHFLIEVNLFVKLFKIPLSISNFTGQTRISKVNGEGQIAR